MNKGMESKYCPKCKSLNAIDAAHCRYCHERFDQAKIFVERKKKKRLNRNLLFAGGLLAVVAGYIFKKKSSAESEKSRSSAELKD